MFCTECGKQLDSNAKFCPNCGAKIDAHTQPELAGQQGQQKKTKKVRRSFIIVLLAVIIVVAVGVILGCIAGSQKSSNDSAQGLPSGSGAVGSGNVNTESTNHTEEAEKSAANNTEQNIVYLLKKRNVVAEDGSEQEIEYIFDQNTLELTGTYIDETGESDTIYYAIYDQYGQKLKDTEYYSSLERTCTYENNRCISVQQTYFLLDGEESTVYIENDIEGKPIRGTYEMGGEKESFEYTYGERGLDNKIKGVSSTQESVEYTFDQEGNIVHETSYLSDGTVSSEKTYDAYGNSVEEVTYMGEVMTVCKNEYTYDNNGNVMKKISQLYQGDDLIEETTETYQYQAIEFNMP